MDLSLEHSQYRADGIFGSLVDENGVVIASTLEHSYLTTPASYKGKIPPGAYKCVRGIHELEHLGAFETFEVTGVTGHTGILFHIGNFNADSDGCILLGEGIVSSVKGQMLVGSRETFTQFMKIQEGLDSFLLIVSV